MRMLIAALICTLLLCACTQQIPKPRASARGSSTVKQPTLDDLKSRADKLLSQMASKNYKQREEATKALRKLLKETGGNQQALVKYLQEHYQESEDIEVHLRLEPILDRYLRPWKCFKRLRSLGEDGPPCHIPSVAFNPDGRMVAFSSKPSSALGETTIHIGIWDPKTSKRLKKIEVRTHHAGAVSFSPDCKMLASAGEKRTVAIWNPYSGKRLYTLKGHKYPVELVQFSPDGKLLASKGLPPVGNTGKYAREIKLWDTKSCECVRTIEVAKGTTHIKSIAFSSDSKYLAVSLHSDVLIWDLRTNKEPRTFKGREGWWVQSLAFSHDGKLLATGCDDAIRIWDANTGECVRTLKGHKSIVWTVTFSPDSRMLASGDRDRVIRIWDPQTGKQLRALQGHTVDVCALTFSPDSKMLASSDAYGNVFIWGIPEESEEDKEEEKSK